MVVRENSLQRYQSIFEKNKVEMIMLGKEENDIKRMGKILVNINSHFLFPTDDQEKLYEYTKKLIENGYNFIFRKAHEDIGILSVYANNYETKTAYTSTIGIIPTERGGRLIAYIVNFALEFAKEKGMERFRAEVHKGNEKWLNYLQSFKFRIEGETNNDTYMIMREL